MLNQLHTLGLTVGASPEEVKKAYRELAKIHHPDRGGDASRMSSINAAYDELKELDAATLANPPRQAPPRPTRSPNTTQRPTPPGRDLQFDGAAIRDATTKARDRALTEFCLEITKDWIKASKTADTISYRLRLPVRKFAKPRSLHIHILDTISIAADGTLRYHLFTAILPGENLFALPFARQSDTSLNFKGYCWTNVFSTKTRSDGLVITFGDGTKAEIIPGNRVPPIYESHRPHTLFNEGSAILTETQAFVTRLKGSQFKPWLLVGKGIRALWEYFT